MSVLEELNGATMTEYEYQKQQEKKPKRFSIYLKTKNNKWWKTDMHPHTLREARELVKSFRTHGYKAYYKPW